MTIINVFLTFLRLGCISFGGPAAHIGYFEREFVRDKRWLSEEHYAQLVALCQFLPGPASSQVGFGIGLQKAGLLGAVAAFIGFTLPSFLIMLALAFSAGLWLDNTLAQGAMHGLKLLAVVVVADAVLVMSQKFCQDTKTQSLAVLTAIVMWLLPSVAIQMLTLIMAALAGWLWLPKAASPASNPSDKAAIQWRWLVVFVGLWLAPLLFSSSQVSVLWSGFYQAGALVFGGGHVVLPLIQQMLGSSLSTDSLLIGYSAAQAVPGPMFSMVAYMGAEMFGNTVVGAVIASLAVFLPGFLLLLTFKDAWFTVARHPALAGAIGGVNAAVVGLLLAALYQPVFVSAVVSLVDIAVVALGLLLLKAYRLPIVYLVLLFVGFSVVLSLI